MANLLGTFEFLFSAYFMQVRACSHLQTGLAPDLFKISSSKNANQTFDICSELSCSLSHYGQLNLCSV